MKRPNQNSSQQIHVKSQVSGPQPRLWVAISQAHTHRHARNKQRMGLRFCGIIQYHDFTTTSFSLIPLHIARVIRTLPWHYMTIGR